MNDRILKNVLSLYLNKWYVPVFVAGLSGFLGIMCLSIHSEIIAYLSLGVPFFALVASIILGFTKFLKKRFIAGILQIVSTVVLGYGGFSVVALYLAFYPFDFYANNLSIPESIELYIPKDSLAKVWNPHDNLEIYNDIQPGIYTYEAALTSMEKGTIYLKAYEVTRNDQLSAEGLKMRTSLRIENTSETLVRYISKQSFTIYEGDWGDYYAARFELWFKPENGKEKKITEKIYKIEGWQR